MWDHIPANAVAALAAPATTEQPQDTQRQRDQDDTPLLHAFPNGSHVSLCGKTRDGSERANADRFCKVCEGLASSVAHRG